MNRGALAVTSVSPTRVSPHKGWWVLRGSPSICAPLRRARIHQNETPAARYLGYIIERELYLGYNRPSVPRGDPFRRDDMPGRAATRSEAAVKALPNSPNDYP